MEQIIKKIDDLIEEKIPKFKNTFYPPATDAEFESLEDAVGAKLPNEFKTLYKWHNGQSWSPYIPFHVATQERLMPIAEMIDWYKELSGQLEWGDIDEDVWKKSWLPFTDDGTGNSTCIDLSKDNFGQIIYQDHEGDETHITFNSMSEWLEDLLNKMRVFDYSTWDYLDRL
ncbi:SMI1/KNR4 family protein [Psychrobacter ciconiae]|uniref:SMI1/KNR4 family protein n=1 Tax=Psychrobacter ciconiae TaxID=1553449 RepID=UPI00191ACA22|nr:SMI1/KNR4 family protein [Psychrobacter ciconiae]